MRLGKQGDRVTAEGPLEVWARPLARGAIDAVAMFNREDQPLTYSFGLKEGGGEVGGASLRIFGRRRRCRRWMGG